MNTICPQCDFHGTHLMKHISEVHPDLQKEQEILVLKYYAKGLSAKKIAALPDIYYVGASSIVRLLKKYFNEEELESGRRSRIGNTLKEDYAAGKNDHILQINIERVKSEEGRKKNSAGLKEAYDSGRKVPWALGLTKDTSPKIAEMAKKVSQTNSELFSNNPLPHAFKKGPENPHWKENREDVSALRRNTLVFSKTNRRKIKEKFNNACRLCHISEDLLRAEKAILKESRLDLECDHIDPIFKGGTGDYQDNAQALCSRCHIIKGIIEKGYDPSKMIKTYQAHPAIILAHKFNFNILPNNILEKDGLKFFIMPLTKSFTQNIEYVSNLQKDNCYTIYADEWFLKRNIVESIIKNKLKLSHAIPGRKCSITTLTQEESKTFFEENHISGNVRSIKTFGLKYGGVIVTAVSLRKPFTKKHKDYIEIARFASKLGYRIHGGFSKILPHIKAYVQAENLLGIMTYADLRLGSGQVYIKAGFTYTGKTALDYAYTNGYDRYGRFIFRATNDKSEKTVAEENGVYRVYGAGSACFKLDL
jgi:5-methylcytosine-specific restriction endonuclease McrA